MKANVLLTLLTVATLLLSCSTDESGDAPSPSSTPVALSASVQGPQTRGGATGSIDYSVLARSGYSFSLFAFGVEGGPWLDKKVSWYDETGSTSVSNLGDVHLHPGDWLYDQKTTDWPTDATVTFLAYAPYVDKPISDTSNGITAISSSDADDTTVGYALSTALSGAVDLLWAVREDKNSAGLLRLPWTAATIANSSVAASADNIAPGGIVHLTFHHATAAIGFHAQVMIDKENDANDPSDQSTVADILNNYKVTLQRIDVSGNFHPSGTLNLKNTTPGIPAWTKVALEGKTLTASSSDMTADVTTTGITQVPQQLVLAPHTTTGAEQLFFVIPNTDVDNDDYTVTVYWTVQHKTGENTWDTGETHTTNIAVEGLPLLHDTKYYLNLIFSLKTVSLTVSAEDWEGKEVPVEVAIERGTSASSSLARSNKPE